MIVSAIEAAWLTGYSERTIRNHILRAHNAGLFSFSKSTGVGVRKWELDTALLAQLLNIVIPDARLKELETRRLATAKPLPTLPVAQRAPSEPVETDLDALDSPADSDRVKALELELARYRVLEQAGAFEKRERIPPSRKIPEDTGITPRDGPQKPLFRQYTYDPRKDTLPEGYRSLREFMNQHRLPKTTVERARNAKRFAYHEGKWMRHGAHTQFALDYEQQIAFLLFYRIHPKFQFCDDATCPCTDISVG